jgi:UDP-N-acetylmuramoyl-tripeptide--D-alanyl-D-alanine ligase
MKISAKEIEIATEGRLIAGDSAQIALAVSTDSRADCNKTLFVPLSGPNFDGRQFIGQAFEKGATIALTDRDADAAGWRARRADGSGSGSESESGDASRSGGAGESEGADGSGGAGIDWQRYKDRALIKVDDTLAALGRLAAWHRHRFAPLVVGITGSVGKTTAKDMISLVLGKKYEVHKTLGNFNNEIGLPLTIFGLTEKHTAMVLEMGMSRPGEIRRLSKIARPDMVVITNVGQAHIEQLGTRQGILGAKLEILDGLAKSGTVVLNGDDALLRGLAGSLDRQTVYYGIGGGEGAGGNAESGSAGIASSASGGSANSAGEGDTSGSNAGSDGGAENGGGSDGAAGLDVAGRIIKLNGDRGFELGFRWRQREYCASVRAVGRHNAYNALAAVAVGLCSGVRPERIVEALAEYRPDRMRMNVADLGGVKLINDAYNANPQSMRAALDVLADLEAGPGGKKIAVLGDMLELGELSGQCHRDIGAYAASKGIDVIVSAGRYAGCVRDGAEQAARAAVAGTATADADIATFADAAATAAAATVAVPADSAATADADTAMPVNAAAAVDVPADAAVVAGAGRPPVIKAFESKGGAEDFVLGAIGSGDIVLVKGSRATAMESIVDSIAAKMAPAGPDSEPERGAGQAPGGEARKGDGRSDA